MGGWQRQTCTVSWAYFVHSTPNTGPKMPWGSQYLASSVPIKMYGGVWVSNQNDNKPNVEIGGVFSQQTFAMAICTPNTNYKTTKLIIALRANAFRKYCHCIAFTISKCQKYLYMLAKTIDFDATNLNMICIFVYVSYQTAPKKHFHITISIYYRSIPLNFWCIFVAARC